MHLREFQSANEKLPSKLITYAKKKTNLFFEFKE